MPDVVMPRLSDSMEEGTVLGWMKAVGDEVAVGDELVEIETDKANMVYESDVAGTLTKREMLPGEAVHITPKTVHRMTAIEDSDIFEVSTPELTDVVRLEDRYGRKDK